MLSFAMLLAPSLYCMMALLVLLAVVPPPLLLGHFLPSIQPLMLLWIP